MRICLIHSAPGSSSEPARQSYDLLVEPFKYISKTQYLFEHRFVHKQNACSDIDAICNEGFDYAISLLDVGSDQTQTNLEDAIYLDQQQLPLLTKTASFQSISKSKMYERLRAVAIHTPQDTSGRLSRSCESSDHNGDSNGRTTGLDNEVLASSTHDTRDLVPEGDVSSQDIIQTQQYSVIIIPLADGGTHILDPVHHLVSGGSKSLDGRSTSGKSAKEYLTFAVVRDIKRSMQLQKTAITALRAANSDAGPVWARVDLQHDSVTGLTTLVDICVAPAIFSSESHPGLSTDDGIIAQTYPNGHAGLLATLITAQRIRSSRAAGESHYPYVAGAQDFYDGYSAKGTYDPNVIASKQWVVMKGVADSFSFAGDVLDLACGTGLWGRALRESSQANASARVFGCDVSAEMVKGDGIRQSYEMPIMMATMQEVLLAGNSRIYDHITCWGALHFLDPIDFVACLSRMFVLARSSISFELDEVPLEYCEGFASRFDCPCYNNSQDLDDFKIPNGWKKAKDDRDFLYKSPNIGCDVYARTVRFERSITI